MAMVDQYPGSPWVPEFPDLRTPLIRLGQAAAIALVFIAIAAKCLPRTSLWDRLTLTAVSAGGSDAPSVSVEPKSLVGREGVAVSILRPAGKAMFGDQLADVVTEGDLIPKDERVRVVRVEGSRVVVTKA
jgi:membrane-bound serine protease (ClpP class)